MPQRKIVICVRMRACHLLIYKEKDFNIEDTVVCKALQGLQYEDRIEMLLRIPGLPGTRILVLMHTTLILPSEEFY